MNRGTLVNVSAVREITVFLDAQGLGPSALNSIHDGLNHLRCGALASQVSGVQLENNGDDA